ncbi:C-type lectin domain family 17, member A-like [Cetorhinus maximus]
MEQDTDYMNMRHIKNNTTDPSERKTGQETAGGRSSITSTHLGIACFIVLIISLAIAIGLRVQVLQMDKNMTGLNGKIQNMSETLEKTRRNLRSICTVLRNCSESLCPSGWKVHNHHCYRLSMESKEWNSAKLQCESLNSHLIIINTEQEQNFINKSVENNLGTYWIGLTDRESEGNWKWVDGTPVRSFPTVEVKLSGL